MDAQRQPLQRILVPTDLGSGAERALARVPWLPLAANAEIFLLYCVPGEPAGTEDARTALDAAAMALERNCRQRGARVRVEPLLRHGARFRVILEQAEWLRAELIVLGRHARRPVADWLGIGTTADRVVRGATAPVLMVRRPARRAYASLLAALDRPPGVATDRAVSTALRLVPESGRTVVLHATHDEYSDAAIGRAGVPPAKIDAWRAARRAEAQREIRAWLEERYPGVRWHLQVSTAEPIRTVLRAASAQAVDLVALGTNSRTAVERWLLGSVAETVLRAADCDVLVASDL